MRRGKGEHENSILRDNMKERREVTLLGRQRACIPKGRRSISKAELGGLSEEGGKGIGLKGTKGIVMRSSRVGCEICAP